MERLSFLPGIPRHKRKCEDSDSVIELLHGVSISPRTKKVRQEVDSTVSSNELFSGSSGFDPAPEVELPDSPSNVVAIAPVAPTDMDLSGEPLEPGPLASLSDERAIVLYKPVTPPLFPGGPSAGSQVLLNARNLPAGVLNASHVLGKKEDELSWLSASKRRARFVELSEEENNHPDVLHQNHLAVIPWDANAPVNRLTVVPLSNASIDDVVAMDEDTDANRNNVNSQPSNSSTSFCYEPWQQYGAPQPQFGSLMQSH